MLSVIMKSYVPYNPILYIIPCIIPYLSNDNIYIIYDITQKFRIRNHRVGSATQSSVLNQHPKVRISVAG